MTFYKAGASKQTAPGGGPGSFPTPVGARGGCAEASFKGGGDEEAACMEENNNRSMKERRENDNGHKAPVPWEADGNSPLFHLWRTGLQ